MKELKAVNEDIGTALNRQNKKLGVINDKMDANQERMGKLDSKI